MIEIPIRVNLSVSESQQQFDLGVSETQRQFDLATPSVVVSEKDYNRLYNKPSINNVVLQNNVTLQQLGLQNIYYNTKEFWNSQPTLIAAAGTIYIYKDYYVRYDDNGDPIYSPAIKIGDGTSFLVDMPTTTGDIADMLLEHIQNAVIHVTNDDKTFWNNKSSAYINPQTSEETLVLSNTSFMLGGLIYNHG
jgi:hypothetical protein